MSPGETSRSKDFTRQDLGPETPGARGVATALVPPALGRGSVLSPRSTLRRVLHPPGPIQRQLTTYGSSWIMTQALALVSRDEEGSFDLSGVLDRDLHPLNPMERRLATRGSSWTTTEVLLRCWYRGY